MASVTFPAESTAAAEEAVDTLRMSGLGGLEAVSGSSFINQFGSLVLDPESVVAEDVGPEVPVLLEFSPTVSNAALLVSELPLSAAYPEAGRASEPHGLRYAPCSFTLTKHVRDIFSRTAFIPALLPA